MAFNDSFNQASLDARWAGSTATLDDANDRVDVSGGTLTAVAGTLTPTNWGALDFSFSFIANSDYADWSVLLPRNDTQPRARIRLRSGGVSGANRISTTTVLEFVDAQYGAFTGVIGVDGQTDTWLNGENTIRVTRDNSGNWEIFLNGTSKGTGAEPAGVTTYYSTEANIAGVIEFAQGSYYVTSASIIEANVDPQLDTPEPDHSIQLGQSGSINFGDGFSDANNDTLTFSIAPDISLLTGWSWNSSTGVATYDGSQALLAQTSYTVTASDGQGGTDATDTALIEVVAPALSFTADSSSPVESETVTLTISNGTGPYTATFDGTAIALATQNATSATINWPSMQTHGSRYNQAADLVLTDTSNSQTYTISITPAITSGHQFAAITSLTGMYVNDTDLAVGDEAIGYTVSGSFDAVDLAVGALVSANGGTYRYNVYDISAGAWLGSADEVIAGPDNEKPVLTVTGPATVSIDEGGSYTEQGATWTDNVDGSGAATVGGDTVDVNTPNTYVVTYNYTDAAGNAADQVIRTVIVSDITAPVITLTGSATVTHAHGTPYTDAGATASDNADGDITNSIAVTNLVNVNAVGSYSVHYDVDDAAGNSATRVTRTVNVTDQAAPVTSLLGSSTINLALGQAFTDPGATATDAVDGNLTAFISVTGSVNVNVANSYTLTYSATDAAGNTGTAQRTVVVAADTSVPVITLQGDATVTHPQGTAYVDAGATASDDIDGNISADIVTSGASFDFNTVGTYYVRYNVQDSAGNAANEVVRTVIVTDQTAPVITLTGGNVTLEQGGTYEEPGNSATDNNDASVTVVITGSVDVNTPGTYIITYDATDAAGNAAVQRVRTVTVTTSTTGGPKSLEATPIYIVANGLAGNDIKTYGVYSDNLWNATVDFNAPLNLTGGTLLSVTWSIEKGDAVTLERNVVQGALAQTEIRSGAQAGTCLIHAEATLDNGVISEYFLIEVVNPVASEGVWVVQ